MQWHMYNVITITRRKYVCDNSLYLYYAAVCLCHKKTMLITNYDNIFVKCNLHPKMFHSLFSLKMRFMCCHYYHIDHYWPLFL